MATQPTQLPVPSEKPQDLKFNAGKIDEFVTSMGWTYEDRFGNKHYTIEGINYLAQQVMAAFGYVTLTGVTFTTGATVSTPNEVLFNQADNSYYKWTGSFADGGKVVPPNSTPQSTGDIGPGKWMNVGDAAVRGALASTDDGNGDAMIGVKQPFTGAVSRTQHDKNAEFWSVKDSGAKGNYVSASNPGNDDTLAIQAVLDAAFNAGGGRVFAPPGVYRTSKPLIVRSNVEFFGAGPSTVIFNAQNTVDHPAYNIIHIGYCYEWNENGEKFNPASNNDATLGQLLSNDFSKITTKNVVVRNMTLKSAGSGLGVWTLNAMDVVIDSIWAIDNLTPINVANDAAGAEAACANISISNIFQVSATGSQWYDLVYSGSAVNVDISRCYNNPNTKSMLPEMIAINGTVRFSITQCNLVGKGNQVQTPLTVGIHIAGDNLSYGVVSQNRIHGVTDAVSMNSAGGVITTDNTFSKCYSPIQLNSQNNTVTNNFFENNILDIAGNSAGSNNVIANNFGIKSNAMAGTTSPEMYNHYSCNFNSNNLNDNYNTYAALRARKIAVFPQDGWLNAADKSKVTISGDGAALSFNAAGSVNIYFKIPNNVKQIKKVVVNLYSAQSGESIGVSLYGINSDFNTNTLPSFQGLPAQVTTSSGDKAFEFGGMNALYAAGTYYVRLAVSAVSTSTQIRNCMIYALCDD